MSRYYRDLRASRPDPPRDLSFGFRPGIPNRVVVRAGWCPGCKDALSDCQCDDGPNEGPLNFDTEDRL